MFVTEWATDDSSVSITENDGTFSASGISKDITFVATTAKAWTATFTDGQGNTLSTVKVQDGKSAKAPDDPTRDGYNFKGWDKDFSKVTSDITISATWKEKPKTYGAGSYRVGTDIAAGEYKFECVSSNGYYCVYPNSSKEDILSNDNFDTCTYVKVSDGQLLEVSGATFVDASEASATTTLSGYGTYKVGLDIPAGEYNITATDDSGYYAVLSTVDATVDFNIVDNDNFEGNSYVTVSKGQYLEISRASIEK